MSWLDYWQGFMVAALVLAVVALLLAVVLYWSDRRR